MSESEREREREDERERESERMRKRKKHFNGPKNFPTKTRFSLEPVIIGATIRFNSIPKKIIVQQNFSEENLLRKIRLNKAGDH